MADDTAEFYEEHPGIESDTRQIPDIGVQETVEAGRNAQDRIDQVSRDRMTLVQDGGHVG